MAQLPKREALRFGWQAFKKEYLFYIIFCVLLFGITIVFQNAQKATEHSMPLLATVFTISSFLYQMVLSVGIIYVTMKVVRGSEPHSSDILRSVRMILRYFAVSILYGAIVILGLILFIIPGVIWAIKFSFAKYLVIDKDDLSIRDAFRESARMTKGVKIELWVFMIMIVGINILGAIAFGVGLLISIPVSIIAMSYMYVELAKRLEPVVEASKPIVSMQSNEDQTSKSL